MRVSDATLAEVRERGFALMEGFLSQTELAAAQEALWLHFPRPSDYFADPGAFARYGAGQFAGVEEFPYCSWDLNGLAVHPDLVDAAERYLRTTELHLYKVPGHKIPTRTFAGWRTFLTLNKSQQNA